MPSREVKVAIIGDPSSLKSALRSVDQGITTFGQRMNQVGARMRSVGATMTRSLTLPLIAFGTIGVRELIAGENALAQTQAVIESTGGAARKSVDDIVALSSELSELSSIDDEDIQGLANTLLTFRNIAGPTFDEATTAALDLSVAMGTDLHAAGVQVGKALNDPIRGMSALTRVGVTFTQQQRDAIQAMVFFGDTAGAQALILEELNAEFGGSAEALGGTLSGRLRKAKQRFEELAAAIIEDLLPVLEDVGDIIDGLADDFDDLSGSNQKVVASLVLFAFVAGPLIGILGFLASTVGLVVLTVGLLAGAVYLAVTNWETLTGVAQNAINNIRNNVPGATMVINELKGAISFVTAVVNGLITFVKILGSLALAGITAAVQVLTGNLSGALGTAQSLVSTLSNALNLSQSLAKQPVNLAPGSGSGDSMNNTDGPRIATNKGGSGGRNALAREIARELSKVVQPVVMVGQG